MRTSWRPTTAVTDSTATADTTTLRRLRAARALSAIVAVGALVTLGLAALWPASTSTVTRRTSAGAAPMLIAPIGTVGPVSTPNPADAGTASATGAAPRVTAAGTTTGLAAVAPSRSDGTATGPSDAPSAPSGSAPTPTPAPSPPASCPLPLPAASPSGGLQSLVGFAPAFGPFVSEGFALAPAYAPVLQLFGPVIARLAAQSPEAAPVLDPLLATLQTLSTSGYSVVAPGYTPYRPQVLSVETQIAQALAPYSEQLAGSPAGACLVDFEAAALSAADG